MSNVDALLQRIQAARPDPIDLTIRELDPLAAYLATLPPLPAPQSSVLGTFSAETARRFPVEIPDPAGTERWRRQHLEFVRRTNERRLAAGSTVREEARQTPNEAPSPINFVALVNVLLELGKPTQAALVRFMADRETATADEIGDKVHGNPEASDKAIGKNARETSDSLAGIGSRLSFRFVSGTMFRKIANE